jgi:hypothetical protein
MATTPLAGMTTSARKQLPTMPRGPPTTLAAMTPGGGAATTTLGKHIAD